MSLLVDKYRPTHLNQIEGQKKVIKEATEWILGWKNQKEKAIIFSGPPGCGKTTLAHALANEYSYDRIELNASDTRTQSEIERILKSASQMRPLFGDTQIKRLLILDEVDNLYGREDKGAAKAIYDLITTSKYPVLMTANKYWDIPQSIRSISKMVQFRRIAWNSILSILKKIASKENIKIDEPILSVIAQNSNGDLRSALNSLQAFEGGTINAENYLQRYGKDYEIDIFSIVGKILKADSAKSSKSIFSSSDKSPEEVLLWIEENMPRTFTAISDIAKAYDALSKSDMYFARAQRKQMYVLWKYAIDLMTVNVSLARTAENTFSKFRAPEYLSNMKSSSKSRKVSRELSRLISSKCHTSEKSVFTDYLPYIRFIFSQNEDMAAAVSLYFEFEVEMIKYLSTDTNMQRKILKRVSEMQKTHTMPLL